MLSNHKPKVLMFGWEFPPSMNGGLGVACLGLCKALSPIVDLTMIVPKSSPEYAEDNFNLVGLNSLDTKDLRETLVKQFNYSNKEVDFFKLSLSPDSPIRDNDFINALLKEVEQAKLERFDINELYGNDMMRNVLEFAKLAVKYGSTLNFDIIHSHDWMTFLPGMELKARTDKPLVVHIHSLEYDRGGEQNKNWVWALEKRAMEYADVVIPVSEYTGWVAEKFYGIEKKKIKPVHNGIATIMPTKKPKNFNDKLVAFVGRITRQKGPEFFVDVAERVLQMYSHVQFVMAGSGDMYHDMICRVASKNIGHKFHFTGFLSKDKVNDLFAMTDVYCMPSVSEPFGLSAVEAVQYDIPIVLSKQSGCAEVLPGSLKADFWDVNKLADYIIALLKYEGLQKQVISTAKRELKDITWGNAAKECLNIYKDTLVK
jgi:glycogen synthase